MARSYRFASLMRPSEIAYTFNTDCMALWDSAYRTTQPLCLHAGRYATLGDGMIQHAPEVACTVGDFADYLASFTAWLLDAEISEDEKRTIASSFSREIPSDRQIAFALSLKYEEGKPAWYSCEDRKVSRAESRQHDRRWEKVSDWADGTPEAAYRLLAPSKGGIVTVLDRFAVAQAVIDYLQRAEDRYGWHACKMIGIVGDDEYGHGIGRFRDAYKIASYAIEAIRAGDNARGSLDCFRTNYCRKKEPAAEKVAG